MNDRGTPITTSPKNILSKKLPLTSQYPFYVAKIIIPIFLEMKKINFILHVNIYPISYCLILFLACNIN